MKTKTSVVAVSIWLLVAFCVGCQRGNQEESAEQPADQSTSKQARAKTKGHRAAEMSRVETITVPSGTALSIRLTDAIDTGTAAAGSQFAGSLAEALVVNGVEVAPVGSAVTGTVTHVVSSGRLNRPAELSLALNSLTPAGGNSVEISTSPVSMKGPSHKKRDIEMIGGGAGVGALIGAIAGKGKGAAIGSAVGAGAGTAGAAITGKKEIRLAPEARLSFRLSAPITLAR